MTQFFDFNKEVNSARLHAEIFAAGLGSILEYVQRFADETVRIATSDSITGPQQTSLTGVVTAHANIRAQPSPATSGVYIHTINGVSGVIDIDITNDGITTSRTQLTPAHACIELTPMFDSGSGVLLNTVSDLVGSGVVNQLNGLSGLVVLGSGVSQLIDVTISGNTVFFDIDRTKLEGVLSLSGISKLEASAAEDFASSTSNSFVEVLTLPFTVDVSGIYRAQWSFQGGCSAANKVCEFRIQVDDSVLISDFMDMTTSFNVGGTGNGLQFGGFVQFGADIGIHDLDFDFRFSDTGNGAVQVTNLRLEVLQIV